MSLQRRIPVEEPGQRVDKLLSAALEDLTRSAVQNLIPRGVRHLWRKTGFQKR